MKYINILDENLKCDFINDLFETYDVDVIYSYDRNYENMEDEHPTPMGPIFYASQAHTLCRRWKEDSGFSLSGVAELIESASGEEIHPSNVSKWMGKSKNHARLIPEKHAYALYMHSEWSPPLGSTKKVDPKDPWGIERLRQELGELENNKGRLLTFPFFQYVRSCVALRPVIAAKQRDKKIKKERLLEILKQSEAQNKTRQEITHLAIRELVENAEQDHVLVDGSSLPLNLTKPRKGFLQTVFDLWVFEDSAWSHELTGRRKPENLRKLLIHLLGEGK